MGLESGVVEISSGEEEEEAEEEEEEEEEGFGWGLDDDVPLDWLSEVYDLGGGGLGEEFDDIVVLDEPAPRSAPRADNPKNSTTGPRLASGPDDGSDDDCVVLDGDPDGGISAVVSGDKVGGDGSDELLIVGEKGQLACRDYPHPRHLCATFPFNTTPHEKYCSMCHCYVCDSPAPCSYWGNGRSSTDHCHCTDKVASWKNERKSFKQRNMLAADLSKPTDATLSMMPLFQNPQPIHHTDPIIIPTPPSRSSPLQIRSATRCLINQRHHQGPQVFPLHGQRVGQHLAKTHPTLPRVQSVRRERPGGGAFATQIMHAQSKFKRVGTPGTGCINLNSSCSRTSIPTQNQIYRPAVPQRPQCPPVTSAEDGIRFWQDILAVATELGVAEETNTRTACVQPYAVSSPASTAGQFHSQLTVTQDTGLVNHSTPPPTNTSSLGFDSNWLTDTTVQNNLEYGQGTQFSNSLVFESNLSPGEISIETFVASVEQETVSGPAKEQGLVDVDPDSLFYDLDGTWSTLAQV